MSEDQDAVVAAELEKFYKATDKPHPALDMAAAPGAGLIAGVGGLLNTVGIDTPLRNAADTLSPRTRDSLAGRVLMGAGSALPYVGLGSGVAAGARALGAGETVAGIAGAAAPASAIGVDAGKQAYERAIHNGASDGAALWSGIAAGSGNAALMMLPMHTFMGQFMGKLNRGNVLGEALIGGGSNAVATVLGKYTSDQIAHHIGNDAEAADLMEAARELGPESALAGALISGVAAYYGKERSKPAAEQKTPENVPNPAGSEPRSTLEAVPPPIVTTPDPLINAPSEEPGYQSYIKQTESIPAPTEPIPTPETPSDQTPVKQPIRITEDLVGSSHGQKDHVFRAFDGDKVVGFAQLAEDFDSVQLQMVEVKGDRKRQGIGTQLVRQAEAYAKSKGKVFVGSSTTEEGTALQKALFPDGIPEKPPEAPDEPLNPGYDEPPPEPATAPPPPDNQPTTNAQPTEPTPSNYRAQRDRFILKADPLRDETQSKVVGANLSPAEKFDRLWLFVRSGRAGVPPEDPAQLEKWAHSAAKEALRNVGGGPDALRNSLREQIVSFFGDTEQSAAVKPLEPTPSVPETPDRAKPPVSIKNASTDAEMARMGLDPTEHPLDPKTFADEWQRAKDEFTPEVGQNLVRDLESKPRPPTAHENALLAFEVNRRINERDAAEEAYIADPSAANKKRIDEATQSYAQIEAVTKQAGTQSSGSLNFRRMMLNRDYSLAALERKLQVAQDGEPLTEEQRAQVSDIARRIAELEKNVSAEEARQKTAQADAAVQALKTEVRARKPRNAAESWIKQKADEARARLKAKRGVASAGFDPQDLLDVATIGAEHLVTAGLDVAEWTKAMVHEFGDEIKPHLDDLYKTAKAQFDKANVERLVAKVSERRASDENADPSIRALAKHFIEQGVEPKSEPITAAIQGVLPDLSPREIHDAISGYGRFRELSKEESDVKLRELSGVMRELSKLEDVQKRIPPKKSGYERAKPTDEERQLRQRVAELAKQYGLKGGTHDALGALKSRLKNQITDLQTQIDKGERIVPERKPVERDAEAAALQARVDELRATYKDLFGSEKTDEQRAAAALKHAEESLAEYERKLRENDLWPKTKQGPPTKTVQEILDQKKAIEARRNALRKEVEQLRNPPKSPEERRQDAAHTRIANELARMLEAKARGDYSKKPKPVPVPLRPETVKAKAELEKVKREFEIERRRAELAKRTPFQKMMDRAAKLNEAAILSTPTVIAKLTSAGAERMAFTPLEEAAGVAFAKMFPRVAEKAPREGGFSPAAEMAAVIQGAKNAVKDFMDTLRTGHSELDMAYSKKYDVEPKSWLDYIRHMHGALKATTKRNEFARSFQKRMEWEIRAGNDPHDPVVQMRVGTSAYIDANRSIFMDDNAVVDAYRRAMSRFAGPGVTNKIVSTAGKFALPIVRVPTNVVAETFQYALGSVTGGARLARAYRNGIENLSPEEADIILRSLKKGSIGAAVMALGYMNAKNVGGYYAPGKRKEDDVKFGHIKVFGVDIPSMLIHNPLLETLQIGASMRRVADSMKKGEPAGTGNGAMAATVGLLEQVPFVRETLDMSKVVEQAQQGSGADAAGAIVGDRLVPGVVKWAARATDTDKQGETVKRKAIGFNQTVQSGIPWLRKRLPAK